MTTRSQARSPATTQAPPARSDAVADDEDAGHANAQAPVSDSLGSAQDATGMPQPSEDEAVMVDDVPGHAHDAAQMPQALADEDGKAPCEEQDRALAVVPTHDTTSPVPTQALKPVGSELRHGQSRPAQTSGTTRW